MVRVFQKIISVEVDQTLLLSSVLKRNGKQAAAAMKRKPLVTSDPD